MGCQIQCQGGGYATCESNAQADCAGRCSSGGALICDGDYVQATDMVACIDQIEASFGVTVTGCPH
jgi:hypothetical protein